jgi:hypothetical protein
MVACCPIQTPARVQPQYWVLQIRSGQTEWKIFVPHQPHSFTTNVERVHKTCTISLEKSRQPQLNSVAGREDVVTLKSSSALPLEAFSLQCRIYTPRPGCSSECSASVRGSRGDTPYVVCAGGPIALRRIMFVCKSCFHSTSAALRKRFSRSPLLCIFQRHPDLDYMYFPRAVS